MKKFLLPLSRTIVALGKRIKKPRLQTLFVVAISTLAIPAASYAQQSGSLSGRVSQLESGKSLGGAIVSVQNTNFRHATDKNGQYTLSSLPVGSYFVDVSYVGLEAETREVQIRSSQTTELNVTLASKVIELESFTVQAAISGQAIAINQQKSANGILNVVSEETFGDVTDGNIGKVLQQLPGISVNEDQDGSPGSINIRGIPGEFNSVQIDGNRMPSSGGSRSFNPRELSADGITAIEVVKAPTPDRDGDAIGGIVNLVTRNAFQRESRSMKLKLGATLNDASDNWGNSASLSYSDLLSVGKGDNNLGVSFTVSSYDTDRYSENADQDWVQVDPATNPSLNLDDYEEPVWFMESTHFEHDTRKTTTQTFSGSIDYRIDENNSFYFRPVISHYDRAGITYETDIDIDTEFENDADGAKTYDSLTPTSGRGSEDSAASRGWIGTLDDQYNDLYSFSVGGRHQNDTNLLTYDIFHSSNKRVVKNDTELNMLMEPEDPYFIFEYQVIDPNGDVKVDVVNGVDSTDLSQMTEGELEFVSGEKTEDVISAAVDWEKTFGGGDGVFTFRTGLKYRKSSQKFDEDVNLYEMDEDFPYANVLLATDEVLFLKQKFFNVQPQVGIDLFATNPELFEFVEDDSLEDSNVADYDATEETTAAYVMGTYQRGITTIIAGVRLEKNEWDNTNKLVSYLDEIPSLTSVKQGNSNTFWLPGIHFRHTLSENLILRESYNRSYGRPKLDELSRGRFTDDDGNIEDGNPYLEPAISDNLDAQIEYYTDNGGLYSVGVFYKDVSDFTYTQVYDFDEIDENGIPIPVDGGDLEYEHPVNGAGAVNYGIELIARQRLYFLPGPLKGLAAGFSATFTESDAEYPNRDDNRDLPLEGFSKTLYTAMIDYNWGNISARIDYRFRDDYIEGLGDDIESDEFYAAEYRLDAQFRYRLRDNMSLTATGTNLTEQPQVSYQGYSQFVEDASFAGRKFSFGVEYEF